MAEGRPGTADRLIGLAAPFLDLVLAVGDRVSRFAEPEDYEYYPIRPAAERELPEGLVADPEAADEDDA